MEQHFVLCGLGRVGRRVLESLEAARLPVVVIDTQPTRHDGAISTHSLRGDCRKRELLEEAGVAKARGVLILTSDQSVNISTLLMVRSLNPHVRIVVRLFNQNLINRLGDAVGNVYALSVSGLVAPLLALTALTGQTLGTFRLENGKAGEAWQVIELLIAEDSALRGMVIRDLATAHGVTPIAHLPTGGGERLLSEIDAGASLSAGDRLFVCGKAADLDPLLGRAAGELLPDLRWAHWLRRSLRIARHTFADVEWPVRVCTLILLVVIALSTAVFYAGVDKYDLTDALHRSVAVIVTGSDAGDGDLQTPAMRLFVSVLRLAGVTLVAAFTAIFTNYLLRARLGAALEVRRIPDSGHVIVCGLGNVGFRVVEELLRRHEPVVVIEQSRETRFVATTRRLGVPVIIGDATVPEVLRQAHAGEARAVVAASSDELTNLEIGLLVREINPTKHVVLRINDTQLAQSLRESARIRLALSIPALAAPAFVAPLFGDRVQCVFLVGSRPLAVVDVLVEPRDVHLIGSPVPTLAEKHRLLVIDHTASAGAKTDGVVSQGDRLTVIAALPDLQRLVHAS